MNKLSLYKRPLHCTDEKEKYILKKMNGIKIVIKTILIK